MLAAPDPDLSPPTRKGSIGFLFVGPRREGRVGRLF